MRKQTGRHKQVKSVDHFENINRFNKTSASKNKVGLNTNNEKDNGKQKNVPKLKLNKQYIFF